MLKRDDNAVKKIDIFASNLYVLHKFWYSKKLFSDLHLNF